MQRAFSFTGHKLKDFSISFLQSLFYLAHCIKKLPKPKDLESLQCVYLESRIIL